MTADETLRRARSSDVLDKGMRIGLVAYGALHLLFAFIAFQLAWSDASTSSSGALQQLAKETYGQVILWGAAVGLLLLAVWQAVEAAAGYRWRESGRLRKRVESGVRTVVYLLLAWLAASTAAGLGGGTSEQGLTARLMSATAGRWLVGAVGLAVVGYGGAQLVKGITTRFTEDLEGAGTAGGSGSTLVRLGQVGYIGKGTALVAVGALFVWAAATYDAQKAGGLDAALHTLVHQPYGPVLVTAIAIGLAAFGIYCFGWARHAKT